MSDQNSSTTGARGGTPKPPATQSIWAAVSQLAFGELRPHPMSDEAEDLAAKWEIPQLARLQDAITARLVDPEAPHYPLPEQTVVISLPLSGNGPAWVAVHYCPWPRLPTAEVGGPFSVWTPRELWRDRMTPQRLSALLDHLQRRFTEQCGRPIGLGELDQMLRDDIARERRDAELIEDAETRLREAACNEVRSLWGKCRTRSGRPPPEVWPHLHWESRDSDAEVPVWRVHLAVLKDPRIVITYHIRSDPALGGMVVSGAVEPDGEHPGYETYHGPTFYDVTVELDAPMSPTLEAFIAADAGPGSPKDRQERQIMVWLDVLHKQQPHDRPNLPETMVRDRWRTELRSRGVEQQIVLALYYGEDCKRMRGKPGERNRP